jgi:F-type H+-transporting ATPase subunit epsilon
MAESFALEIHTLRRFFFSGPVEEVVVVLEDGECGVLKNHTRFTAPIVPCIAKIKKEGGELMKAFLSEGVIEVKKHKTIILAECAELPDEIDAERAEKAKAEALRQLEARADDTEKLKLKIKKATLRLKLAGYEESSPIRTTGPRPA